MTASMFETADTGVEITVSADAFRYLRLQRGAIYDLSTDRKAWQRAYASTLAQDIESMDKFLPAAAHRMLDVGSGLGGIDVALAPRFDDPAIWLLDGIDDEPVVGPHSRTFSSASSASNFLLDNGIQNFACLDPDNLPAPEPCDLILSLQAWCFHFPPSLYLEFVRSCCHEGTVAIIDIRRERVDWMDELATVFKRRLGVCRSSEKYQRYALGI